VSLLDSLSPAKPSHWEPLDPQMCKRSPTVTHTLSWSPYEPNIFATCLLSYGQCDIVRAQQYDRRFQIPEMARTSSSHWKKSKMICCILPSSSDAQCFETARKFMAAHDVQVSKPMWTVLKYPYLIQSPHLLYFSPNFIFSLTSFSETKSSY